MFCGISYWIWALIFGVYAGRLFGRQELRTQLRIAKMHSEKRQLKSEMRNRYDLYLKSKPHKRLKSADPKSVTCRRCEAQLVAPTLPIPSSENKRDDEGIMELAHEFTFNSWSESDIPGVTMATTGCELTDAIFGAAHDADIVPEEFFQSLEKKEL